MPSLDGGGDDLADGLRARPMSREPREPALLRPATVAVHDDGDVRGRALGIELGEQLAARFPRKKSALEEASGLTPYTSMISASLRFERLVDLLDVRRR